MAVKKMKTLTINNVTYEIIDEHARKNMSGNSNGSSDSVSNSNFRPITFEDVDIKSTYVFPNGIEYRGSANRMISIMPSENHCIFSTSVKKNDIFVKSNAHTLISENPYLIVANEDDNVISVINFNYIDTYTFTEDGYLYTCFDYTTIQTGEFFYIKTPGSNEPYVLYENMAEIYKTDSTYGDNAIDAIMSGRQILIKVTNADGNNYASLYSPIYRYDIPNYMNDYLYLFYLIDGMDPNGLPIPAQLKLCLSRTYNQSPLL